MEKNKEGKKQISVNLKLNEERFNKLETLADKNYTDKTKLIRKWIDENYKEDFSEDVD